MAKANVFPKNELQQDTDFDESTITQDGVIAEEQYPPIVHTGPQRSTTVPVIALAKHKEEVYMHQVGKPVDSPPDSAALLLLRALRDESHRFALKAHRKKRSKLNGY